MKGLFIKDIMLMKMQWRFFALIVGISVLMGFSTGDFSFVLGYMTFLVPIFSISTASYDDFDNGMSFLFTLPVTRKTYVYEKYLFSASLGIAGGLLGIIISAASALLTNADGFIDALSGYPVIFALMFILVSVMLPLQLKFGAERARIAVIVIGGIVFLLGFGISKLAEIAKIDITPMLDAFAELDMLIIYLLTLAASLVTVIISVIISNKIMNKKEF